MKKLLVIILALFSLQSFAQDTTYVKVRGIPGAYNFSKSGDSLIFYVAGVRNALSVGTVVDLTPFLRKIDTADMLLPYATKDKLKEDSTAFQNSLTNKVDKTTTVNGKALSSNITLTKSDVGLSNVDNTSDISKPVSTAMQNALNLKANDNAVVHLAGTETFTGQKTFSNGLYVSGSGAYDAAGAARFDVLNTVYGTTWYTQVGNTGVWQLANGQNTKVLINPSANGEVDFYTGTGNVVFNGTGSLIANSFKKIGGTSSQFLKADGSTDANSYATITRLQDSINVLNAKLSTKRDTSYYQPIGMVYPFRATMTGDSATFYFPQSWKDTLAYKVDVWPLTGSPVASSANKFLGYSVADTLDFRVKNGFSGVINASNQNTGFGYLGFTDAGAQKSRGSFNTWLGSHAGSGINYSTGGTFLGQNARVSLDSSINVIVVGSDALATKNNQTVIGNVNTKETKLYGTILGGSTGTDTLAKKVDLVNYVTLKNISDTLKTRTYANDSTAFVDGHLNQWDLYRTGGSVKILTTLPYDTSMFNFIVDNRDGSSTNLKLNIKTYNSAITATVYWGDGDSTVMTGDSSNYFPIHAYASAGYYIAKIKFPVISNLHELSVNTVSSSIKIAGFYGISKLTNLRVFSASYSSLASTIVDAMSFPSTLLTLNIDHNNLTGFNTALPASVTTLNLSSNKIPSSATLNLPATLTSLKILSQAPGGITWNSADVNTMLQYVDSKTFNAGAKTLDIRQFNSAPPTGAGLTAKTNLTAEGWTVTTD